MPSINSPTPDATTASKGKVQLAGDLGGTAALPRLALSPTTGTNTGTGGGSINLIVMGNIKMLWGTTNTQSLANNGNSTFPIIFGTTFTNIPTVVATPYLPPDNRVSAVISAASTTGVTVLLQSNNAGAMSVALTWYAIGV